MESNFPGMRGLILVLMLNVCYLSEILILMVVTWWLLLVTWWLLLVTATYLMVTGELPDGYLWLLVIIGGQCSLPLITARFHF